MPAPASLLVRRMNPATLSCSARSEASFAYTMCPGIVELIFDVALELRRDGQVMHLIDAL